MLSLFRTNEGLLIAVALGLGFTLVLALMSLILRVAGVSLKPILFIAGLAFPLITVFLIGHLIRARAPEEPVQASTPGLQVTNGQFAQRTDLFGPDFPAEQIQNAQLIFPELVGSADHAEFGLIGNGETLLIATFPSNSQAQTAATTYWNLFQVDGNLSEAATLGKGKRKLSSDFVELLRSGRNLFVWTSMDSEVSSRRKDAMALKHPPYSVAEPTPSSAPPLFPLLQPLGRSFSHPLAKIGGVLFMAALYTIWFFKGAAWVSQQPAVPHVQPQTASKLLTQLEAINQLDVPFKITPGKNPNELDVTWKYSDSRWVSASNLHASRRTFRIHLKLDEARKKVFATDYVTSYDASAGMDGAHLQWKAVSGIVFFQYEHQRGLGILLDENGKLRPEPTYQYTFNLQEMKSPLIQTITHSGWDWQPTLFQFPSWVPDFLK